jgi:serine/threonine-protein kinase HipA
MWIGDDSDPFKDSQVEGVVKRAHVYQLTENEAREIVDHQITVVERDFDEVCELAELPGVDRQRFWKRQFVNPYSLDGYRVPR